MAAEPDSAAHLLQLLHGLERRREHAAAVRALLRPSTNPNLDPDPNPNPDPNLDPDPDPNPEPNPDPGPNSSPKPNPHQVNGSKQIDMGLVWYMAAHDHLRRATPSLAPLSTVDEVPMERHLLTLP